MHTSSLRCLVILAMAAATLPGSAPGARAQDPPRVLSQSDHIAACSKMPPAQRDVCLAGRALRSRDVGLCAAAGSQGCADLAAMITLPKCAQYPGQARAACELAVATELNSTRVCEATMDPDGCLVAVAAERGDVNIVLAAARNPEHRDRLLAQYAPLARDDSVLARITDPIIHNKTVVLLAPVMMNKPGFTLTQDWCRKLRALPAGADADALSGATPAFCRISVALAERLSQAMDAAETERERAQVAQVFAAAVDAMEKNTSMSVEEIAAELDPASEGGASSAFEGVWSCPQRGTLTLRVNADSSVVGSVAGRPGEHWGGDQRKGGSITGAVTDGSLKLDMNSGDGTVSRMDATLRDNGASLSGGWTWWRGTAQLGSGTWSCQRAR